MSDPRRPLPDLPLVGCLATRRSASPTLSFVGDPPGRQGGVRGIVFDTGKHVAGGAGTPSSAADAWWM